MHNSIDIKTYYLFTNYVFFEPNVWFSIPIFSRRSFDGKIDSLNHNGWTRVSSIFDRRRLGLISIDLISIVLISILKYEMNFTLKK